MARHIITHDPFVSLDLGGVGSVMQSAVARIRSHKDSAKIKVRAHRICIGTRVL